MGKVDMKSVMGQHRKRWKVQTHIGDIVLKHPTRLDWGRVQMRIMAEDPEYEFELERMKWYEMKSKAEEGLTVDEIVDYQNLRKKDLPRMDYYVLTCFEDPELNEPEELHALSQALTDQEWNKLQEVFVNLITHREISEAELAVAGLCQKWGVPMSQDLTMENITVEQFSIIQQVVEMENRILEENSKG